MEETQNEMREGRNGGKLKTGGVHEGSGRPRKLPAIDVIIGDVLGETRELNNEEITIAEAILVKLRQQALKGNIRAAEILLDRAYGKVTMNINAKLTTNGEEFDGFGFLPKKPKEEQGD